MKVAIIDYGSGNLRSAMRAVDAVMKENKIKGNVELITTPEQVKIADKIILPGVGAFADCRAGLDSVEGLVETIEDRVINNAVPFLGVCVGMQLMAQRGLEKKITEGFGWIEGEVGELKAKKGFKVPQMGWNSLELCKQHSQKDLLRDIPLGEDGLHAYFVHSYCFRTEQENILAITDYGEPIPAIVGKDNYVGTQFHPEKSQKLGKMLLQNFLEWKP